jgi:hypothetical protein
MQEKHPYLKRRSVYDCALMVFRYFLLDAPAIVEQEIARVPRAGPLRAAHGFNVISFDKLEQIPVT